MRGFLLACLALGVLAGCGGSGETAAVANLAFAPAGSYNGSSAELRKGTVGTTVTAEKTTVMLRDGDRTLVVEVPFAALENNQTFAIGTSDGAKVTYTEAVRATSRTWIATGGQVSITTTTGDSVARLQISAGTFAADVTATGNPASGTFMLAGDIGNVRLDAGGGLQIGAANVRFSAVTGSNVNSGGFPFLTVGAFSQLEGNTQLVATAETGQPTQRTLRIEIAASVAVGTTVANGSGMRAFYAEGLPTASVRRWSSTGGQIRLLKKTATEVSVQLIGTTFGVEGTPQNTATGTFTINGRVKAKV